VSTVQLDSLEQLVSILYLFKPQVERTVPVVKVVLAAAAAAANIVFSVLMVPGTAAAAAAVVVKEDKPVKVALAEVGHLESTYSITEQTAKC
jgi:hypothetical protein